MLNGTIERTPLRIRRFLLAFSSNKSAILSSTSVQGYSIYLPSSRVIGEAQADSSSTSVVRRSDQLRAVNYSVSDALFIVFHYAILSG